MPGPAIRDLFEAVESLPPLPTVAMRVVQLCNDPRSNAADLVTVVSADPGLTARMLRTANSPVYRRLTEVTSIQQAIVAMGFSQARNLALTGALATAYPPEPAGSAFRMSLFWRHSLAVAFRASDLVRRSRAGDPASAFTAGVLNNIGRLVVYHHNRQALEEAVLAAHAEGVPLDDIEQRELGYDHAQAGGLLAIRWGLPGGICAAISRHHQGPPGSLANAVADADAFCTAHGIGPGYVISGAVDGCEHEADFATLVARVDTLMAAITGAHDHIVRAA